MMMMNIITHCSSRNSPEGSGNDCVFVRTLKRQTFWNVLAVTRFLACRNITEIAKTRSTARTQPVVSYPFQKTSTVPEVFKHTPNRVNVFETGKTLPGRSEASLTATMPCRLQQYTATRSLASKLSGHYATKRRTINRYRRFGGV